VSGAGETIRDLAPPATGKAIVAIDLGAGSCRVSLLRWTGSQPRIRIVHRFENGPIEDGPSLRWDIERICSGVTEGLRQAAALAPEGIAAIGADGWAVDYVRLDAHGLPLAAPFCYRDTRNAAAEEAVHRILPPGRLYELTGLQRLRFNTIYQLYADRLAGASPARWLNLPEYVLYRLGARPVSEYTMATHTGLIDLRTRGWCDEIFAALDYDVSLAPELVAPGTCVGQLRGPLAELEPFRDTALIAPACHDTASAIAGIPAVGNDWAYISSGTWSLVGTVLHAPCNSPRACANDFTNQGGSGGRICFHKNINGMWLVQQCVETWRAHGRAWTMAGLIEAATQLPLPAPLLDVDDPELMLPGDMPARINAQRTRKGAPPLDEDPANAPAFASLIFHSLAARYAETLRDVSATADKPLRELYVVGGASRNALLNSLTQKSTGLHVHCCHAESATVGNFAIQLAALGGSADSRGAQANAIAQWARTLAQLAFDE
jgi:rhamnulokinase